MNDGTALLIVETLKEIQKELSLNNERLREIKDELHNIRGDMYG
jgi:hypothetical protein